MRRVGFRLLIVLGVLAVPVVLTLLVSSKCRAALQSMLMDAQPPPAPDYASPTGWAALPGRPDAADRVLVPGTADEQGTAKADVFFLHAGANWTFYWNAPIDHRLVAFLVDGALMEQWASVFNGCCRVYAPRFRQEAIHLSEGGDPAKTRAVDIAYADVRAACRYYLAHENAARPIIIAGAQSGARHALRLLIDEFAGQPLRRQLVTAYVLAPGSTPRCGRSCVTFQSATVRPRSAA